MMFDKIKVEPFMIKKGNRVGKASIEFLDGTLKGWHLVGFTICDDAQKGMYVLFPASIVVNRSEGGKTKPFFFLRPEKSDDLDALQDKILDVYDSMTNRPFNAPRVRGKAEVEPVIAEVENK